MAKLVSKTYADAIFSLAKEEERLDEFWEAAGKVEQIFRQESDFLALFKEPKLSKEEKEQVIREVFGGRIPKEMEGLLLLLMKKGHVDEIASVMDSFIELVKEEKKIGKAQVITAIALPREKKEQVESRLLAITAYRQLEMEFLMEPTLLGGMVIRMKDRVVDTSIRTRLQALSRQLRNIQG